MGILWASRGEGQDEKKEKGGKKGERTNLKQKKTRQERIERTIDPWEDENTLFI